MREFVLMGRGAGGRAWLVPFVPGLLLVALGVLIVVLPQLLVAMVAALFVVSGFGLLSVGWRLRGLGGARPPSGVFKGWDQPQP